MDQLIETTSEQIYSISCTTHCIKVHINLDVSNPVYLLPTLHSNSMYMYLHEQRDDTLYCKQIQMHLNKANSA